MDQTALQKAIDEAYAPLIGQCTCQYCGGRDGEEELVWTGDLDSLGGFEVWFCCRDCLGKDAPCETFTPLAKSNNDFD